MDRHHPIERSTCEPQPLGSLLQDPSGVDDTRAGEVGRRLFHIRTADSSGERSSASILVNRMYASRGYACAALPDEPPPTRITLVASERDATLGTITIGFDSTEGLHVDDLFPQEVGALRRAGRSLCEFTTLAMDRVVRSRGVLASLFHVSYLYAHRVMRYDQLLIEVNPRHVRYYERMLGFEVSGPLRQNPRVRAPAVLMSLDFGHAREQIARFGGRAGSAPDERSLYPEFFSAPEEAGIVARLLRGTAARAKVQPFEWPCQLQA